MTAPAIGIDLGTTYSCVAVYRNGKVEIIPNEEGNRITPSCVAFTETERHIGDAAKNQEALNSKNTVFGVKRLIGSKFKDPVVQMDIKQFPFEVINVGGYPKIKVEYKKEEKTFFPEEISAMVLTKMKEIAENYLGETVRNVVITVPAYFNNSQRQATKDAGSIAGLNVVRVINEPTAAALTYGLETKSDEERTVLIFDLGGGTFDVTVLTIEDEIFEVVATSGDTHLGGEDFDNRMVDHFVKDFQRIHHKDLTINRTAIRRLRTACERAKRLLSTVNQASIDLELLIDGIDYHTTITRARFEDLNADLFNSVINVVKHTLESAKMDVSDIDDVVLVGGSTRIPMVQSLLEKFFNGKAFSKYINPDEAVAYGAAIQAALLDGEDSQELRELLLVDVTPLSIGINSEDTMATFIKRNTKIPTEVTLYCTTAINNQTSVDIEVLEGERVLAKDNNVLSKFTLQGIPPAPRDVPVIAVTYHIDADGILHVSANETSTNKEKKITITDNRVRPSSDEIDEMIREAEKFRNDDILRKKAIDAKNSLYYYCVKAKSKINTLTDQNLQKILMSNINETLEWLEDNPNENLSDYLTKLTKIENICEPNFK